MAKAPKKPVKPTQQPKRARKKKCTAMILHPDRAKRIEYESPLKQRQRLIMKTMRAFMRIYELNGGNVTVSCFEAKITRARYYLWLNGTQPHHRYFQRMIAKARPIDTILDLAESTVVTKIKSNDLTAAMFTINKLGHRRGWQEPGRGDQPNPQVIADAAVKAVQAYQLWLTDNPDASESEKSEWLGRFSSALNVDQKEVVRTMKIQELTASVQ